MASATSSEPKAISLLRDGHRNSLVRAIANICDTEVARISYAQILDGFPTLPLINDGNPPKSMPRSHPSRTQHRQLCAGVLERLEEFRNEYNLENIALDSQAMTEYHSAAPGSRLFNTRLIELAARSIRQIAVDIAALDESRHKDDELGKWVPPSSDQVFWQLSPAGPFPTWFYIKWYKDYQQYPNGVNDLIGYWAENQIFGGVVLFDRRSKDGAYNRDFAGPVDPDAVYFHSERFRMTYRIYKLLDSQKKELVDFLSADSEQSVHICPLPLTASKNNLERVDPEEPIKETRIYRDEWERLPFPDDRWDLRTRDVMSRVDYPRMSDYQAAGERAYERQERIEQKWQQDQA